MDHSLPSQRIQSDNDPRQNYVPQNAYERTPYSAPHILSNSIRRTRPLSRMPIPYTRPAFGRHASACRQRNPSEPLQVQKETKAGWLTGVQSSVKEILSWPWSQNVESSSVEGEVKDPSSSPSSNDPSNIKSTSHIDINALDALMSHVRSKFDCEEDHQRFIQQSLSYSDQFTHQHESIYPYPGRTREIFEQYRVDHRPQAFYQSINSPPFEGYRHLELTAPNHRLSVPAKQSSNLTVDGSLEIDDGLGQHQLPIAIIRARYLSEIITNEFPSPLSSILSSSTNTVTRPVQGKIQKIRQVKEDIVPSEKQQENSSIRKYDEHSLKEADEPSQKEVDSTTNKLQRVENLEKKSCARSTSSGNLDHILQRKHDEPPHKEAEESNAKKLQNTETLKNLVGGRTSVVNLNHNSPMGQNISRENNGAQAKVEINNQGMYTYHDSDSEASENTEEKNSKSVAKDVSTSKNFDSGIIAEIDEEESSKNDANSKSFDSATTVKSDHSEIRKSLIEIANVEDLTGQDDDWSPKSYTSSELSRILGADVEQIYNQLLSSFIADHPLFPEVPYDENGVPIFKFGKQNTDME